MKRDSLKLPLLDMVVISLTAALGMVSKPVIGPLARFITGPIGIPGGVLAGGLYMMFMVFAYGMTRRLYAGTLTALIQAILAVFTGIGGSVGLLSIITYLPPGIAVDLVMFLFKLFRQPRATALACFLSCMAANVAGTFMMWGVVFGMPLSVMSFVPVLLAFSAAALSGGLGGLLAYFVLKRVRRVRIFGNRGETT